MPIQALNMCYNIYRANTLVISFQAAWKNTINKIIDQNNYINASS